MTINYDPSGSGAGREAFIAGGVAFAGTDSALKQEEIDGGFAGCVADTGYFQVPVYISPIAVIFNVEGVDELNLDAATLAGIFKGTITSWDDPAIAALNEGATLPSAPITAVHRSDDSGTTKNFADYLFKVAPDVWDAEPADPFPYQTGEAAQGTSGVVDAVTNGTNTIGYADASKAGDLGTAAILVGDEFVNYTPEAAAAVVDGSPAGDTASDTDLSIKLDRNTDDPSHYPLVLVSYTIGCLEYTDAEVGAAREGVRRLPGQRRGPGRGRRLRRCRAALRRRLGEGRDRPRGDQVTAAAPPAPHCRAAPRVHCTRGRSPTD